YPVDVWAWNSRNFWGRVTRRAPIIVLQHRRVTAPIERSIGPRQCRPIRVRLLRRRSRHSRVARDRTRRNARNNGGKVSRIGAQLLGEILNRLGKVARAQLEVALNRIDLYGLAAHRLEALLEAAIILPRSARSPGTRTSARAGA